MNPKSPEQIYLDANATTPVISPILEKVMETMAVNFGNPSSAHLAGIKAKDLLEETRQLGKKAIGAHGGELLFTSGATEGIQTAIVSVISHYLRYAPRDLHEPIILYGATEHKAVPNTIKHWNSLLGFNARLVEIPVDQRGMLDHDFIARNISSAVMICTMAVNNETGVIQDLYGLEKVIRTHNPDIAWLVDCVQALGKMEISMDTISIDYAPFSGHKLYAPKGIGFLYIRPGKPYTPFVAGGGQESGMRSGTENLPGIAGLHSLFSLLVNQNEVFNSIYKLRQHRTMLVDALRETFSKVTFHGHFENSVPTTLNFSVDDFTGKEVIDLMDAAGIRVSGGSACSSGAHNSFVLDAMGLSDWCCSNAIRLSFGPADSTAFIEKACNAIRAIKPSIVNDQSSNICGLTHLCYQNKQCWLFVSKNQEAIVVNPIQALLPKIKRMLENESLKKITCFIIEDTDQSEQLINNIRDIFGQSVDVLVPDLLGQNGCYFGGDDWSVTFHTVDEKKSMSFSVFNEETQKKVCLTNAFCNLNISSHSLFYATDFTTKYTSLCSNSSLNNQSACETTSVKYDELASQKAANNWLNTHDALVLDVRERGEHLLSLSEIPEKLGCDLENRVINIPIGRLVNAFIDGKLSSDSTYLIVCRTGKRSKQSADILLSLGVKKVANLSKGLARL
ncbi:hypothetical protein N473_13245 [Pseudoalteromonas luteoviolacea CPMOR-1]|uniref:cysteine desulfurase n=1 Tax=Pseudoalteromonas luteoviolacea CPMOR-1 TaxID=1365248 RepID=A0A161YRL1_9GAMM|nr:aminotransferase class V-fold PLP-dependent enzyme [Pseudoalteromonas luteoviolacea]KZN64752.1 hypothetical protein N473_13245 [Pseudoalteromonas luteoviolacea CPMOR-1]